MPRGHRARAPVYFTDRASFQAAATNVSVETFDQAPWANTTLGSPLCANNLARSAGNSLFGSIFSSVSAPHALSDLDGGPDLQDRLTVDLPSVADGAHSRDRRSR